MVRLPRSEIRLGKGVVLTCEIPPECILAELGDAGREREVEVVVDITAAEPRPVPIRQTIDPSSEPAEPWPTDIATLLGDLDTV